MDTVTPVEALLPTHAEYRRYVCHTLTRGHLSTAFHVDDRLAHSFYARRTHRWVRFFDM